MSFQMKCGLLRSSDGHKVADFSQMVILPMHTKPMGDYYDDLCMQTF